MVTNITKREAMTHYLPPNRNTLYIYEVELQKKIIILNLLMLLSTNLQETEQTKEHVKR